jgi:hypothetical protein
MNPIKAGEAAVTIAEAVAPEATKVAESAAQRLLEAGGVFAPPIRSEAVSEAISSLGGKLPPNFYGNGSFDLQIMNVGDVGGYSSNESAHKILGLPNEFMARVAGRTDEYLEATSRVNPPLKLDRTMLTHGWMSPNSNEWTPAVKEMMRKAFKPEA